MKNQVALVVGASSGIGRATAVALVREGARVMASARRVDRLQQLQAEMTKEGLAIESFSADSTNARDMERLAQHTREKFGAIDILVYASGTNTLERALTRLTPPEWDRLVSVNLN